MEADDGAGGDADGCQTGPAGEAIRSMRPPTAQTTATVPWTGSSSQAPGPRTPIKGSAVKSSIANVPGTQISR